MGPTMLAAPSGVGEHGFQQQQHAVPNPAAMVGSPGYPGGYAGEPRPALGGYPMRPPMREDLLGTGLGPRSTAPVSEQWRTAALVLGAIAMAVLAFAVTRSCMHRSARQGRPAAVERSPAAAPAPVPTK
jgi:hypothetical protein